MLRLQVILVIGLTLVVATWSSAAEEVRYYEENGITYRETRAVAREPVRTPVATQPAKPAAVPLARPAAQPQATTQQREFLRTCYVPTTYYVAENYWVGLWNPFDEPYIETRYRPVTFYRAQTQRVTLPVAVCAPQTQVACAAVPQTECRQTVSRVAVATGPGDVAGASQLARTSGPRPADPASRASVPLLAAKPARPPAYTASSGIAPPSSIPTPNYVRSTPAAPAPAYAPPGGYAAPSYAAPSYAVPPATASSPSAAYAPPGGMSYGSEPIGGVSRLDKGPAPWGSR